MNARCSTRALITAALMAIMCASALAQAEAQSERQILQIEVQDDGRLPNGKSAFLEGVTDAVGQKFLVSDTGITQPITVGVYTERPDDDVRVQVVKDHWDHPERDASTAGSGKVEFNFRTFDGFKLKLSAPHETAYQLVVWVGDELPLAMPSIAIPASHYHGVAHAAQASGAPTRGNGVSLSYFELVLIGVVLLLGGAVTALLMRRRQP